MTTENSIILVTNNNNIIDTLKAKLILLREVDNILAVDYEKAYSTISETVPETVLIYCKDENNSCLGLIKKIRETKKIQNISILLILGEYNQDFVLSAYDEDITDFITINADNAELLMRTIWCFKKNSQLNGLNKKTQLLEKLGVIDKATGFYTNKNAKEILETEFENIIETHSNGVLMLVGASEESKKIIKPTEIAEAIKKSIRTSDVVVEGVGQRFYVLLSQTKENGASKVWGKLRATIENGKIIASAICDFRGKTFEDADNLLLNTFIEAEHAGKDMLIAEEKSETEIPIEEPIITSDDWLEKIGSTQKNFKLFKQAFNKKLEKVITPVFFQVQNANEAKLFETKIEQYSNELMSEFILKKSDTVSEVKITYPGFSKINIDILHQGLDTPENKRITMNLNELEENVLTKILTDFIKEFKKATDS